MATNYDQVVKINVETNVDEAIQEFQALKKAIDIVVKNDKYATELKEGLDDIEASWKNVIKREEEAEKKISLINSLNKDILDTQKKLNTLNLNSKERTDLENKLKLLKQIHETASEDSDVKDKLRAIEAQKIQLKLLDEQFKKEKERSQQLTVIRDTFRKSGLGGLAISGVKKIFDYNGTFNKRIEKNDTAIASNESELSGIEQKLIKGEYSSLEEKSKLEERKKALATDTASRKSANIKMAAFQGGINTAIGAIKKFGSIATGIFKVMGIDLKSVFKEVISTIASELKETGIASYNTGSTLFTNATARETQMKYGLSNASNYALTKTMEMLNMKSDEDLVYMNETQKEAFNSLLDRYKNWYEQLESTGAMVKLQQAQLEFKMFKQELSMKLLNWFADHKEAIFTLLEVAMNVLEFIAQAVEGILSLFGKSTSYSRSALGNSDTYLSNTNSNININVNNTNNASANLNSKAELDSSLTSANSNLVKQIASSLSSR